jgi:RNA polymerase sigma-70 factor (ECF subfamily)
MGNMPASTEAIEAMESYSDDVLMTLLIRAAGDELRFNRLFTEMFVRYRVRVCRWCYRVTKDRDAASDLSQEVFLRVFRNIHSFRGDSNLSTWLYVITRNHCLNAVKKIKSGTGTLRAKSRPSGSNQDDAVSAIVRADEYDRMYRWLRTILNPIEVNVFSLHYVDELSLPLITRKLMLSNASGAKAFIVSARRKLKSSRGQRVIQR